MHWLWFSIFLPSKQHKKLSFSKPCKKWVFWLYYSVMLLAGTTGASKESGGGEDVLLFVVCLAMPVPCWCLALLRVLMVYDHKGSDMSYLFLESCTNIFHTKWLCDSAYHLHVYTQASVIMPTRIREYINRFHAHSCVCTRREMMPRPVRKHMRDHAHTSMHIQASNYNHPCMCI